MITIGMNYKILPGKEDNFERMFKNVLSSLQAVTGHGKSALYKDVTDFQSYLIVSEWDSEEDFNAFVQSEKFKQTIYQKPEMAFAIFRELSARLRRREEHAADVRLPDGGAQH